jgi:hypothetical protein
MRRWEEKWASDGLYFGGRRAKKWPEKQSAWPSRFSEFYQIIGRTKEKKD